MSSTTEHQEVERWAAERVKPWAKPQRQDYDFNWMKGAGEKLLNAGCLYEFARESHEFRCQLVINHAPREERSWSPSLQKFERSSAGYIYLVESGWDRWLNDFAPELIANKSFAEVLRTSSTQINESLDALSNYSLFPKAVEVPGRYINYPGSQDVLVQICWCHYTNKEIGEEMERFAERHRPSSEKEPKRTGRKRQSAVRSYLKDLAVLRIRKRFPTTTDLGKRICEVAKYTGYQSCVKEADVYKERSRRGHADATKSNAAKTTMSRARARAVNFFQRLFPWGVPSNF